MTIKRKPLKPVNGWVVVGPDGRFPDFDDIRSTRAGAWRAHEMWSADPGATRAKL